MLPLISWLHLERGAGPEVQGPLEEVLAQQVWFLAPSVASQPLFGGGGGGGGGGGARVERKKNKKRLETLARFLRAIGM